MSPNYLKQHTEAFFSEATSLNANLKIIDVLLTTRNQQLKVDFPISNYTLYKMISCYRDLSQLEGGSNLYPTGNSYELTTDNLDDEIVRILSYVSCLTLSQIFDAFESFLKNIIAETICHNPHIQKKIKIVFQNDDFISIRNELYRIQGSNNKGFIKTIRGTSPFFKSHERNNIWKRDMSNWFDLIAIIRHIVVHRRQNVPGDFMEAMTKKNLKKLFQNNFSLKKNLLLLNPYNADEIINNLLEYAHLIYKSLSIDLELNKDFTFIEKNNFQ
ncbi:hypothetical protein SNE26_13655 [Mucilaginibacter sp. cycad4]|uniref:hypothetical protein n=1 Tax=Mucilaginibacter sp. cycad4 TaxID=3342096 RepID=UPI002AAAA879|nr:hypothetical protein [Mucilaginibacter gossypii]WPV02828.1 hypothetical protein SNE26_13655 [Mucilaginibacter gossypii]